jgi:hypothetical protein
MPSPGNSVGFVVLLERLLNGLALRQATLVFSRIRMTGMTLTDYGCFRRVLPLK